MAYKWGIVDGIFVVRWRELTIPDLDKQLHDLSNAHRAAHRPVTYVATIPEDSPVPTSEQRVALKQFASDAEQHCNVIHMVFEGNSIKHTLQRSVITGIVMLLQRSGKMHIHKTLNDALQNACSVENVEYSSVVSKLRARGLAD